MQALAEFVMRGRLQAVMVVVMFAGLSYLLPPLSSPLSFLSGAALALVGLRQGPQQGLWVLVVATALMALFSQIGLGSVAPALLAAIMFWLPVWVLALVLHRTVSLSQTLALAFTLGVVIVLVAFVMLGDPAAWWYQTLDSNFRPLLEMALSGAEQAENFIEQLLNELALKMTGTLAMGMVMHALFCLLLGRWWQARLYNPGGFQQEFHGLRLSKGLALVALMILVTAVLGRSHLMINLLSVAQMIFVMQGLAVVHAIVKARALHVGWLVAMYLLLPWTMTLVSLLGLVDAWADIRARLQLARKNDS